MPAYSPPIADYRFLFQEVLCLDKTLPSLFRELELDAELLLSVLEEAGKFCRDVLQPLNALGDEQGCKLADGAVITPPGFAEAYRAFVEAGWSSVSAPSAFGGQGLPRVLQQALDEMACACNLSFGLFSGLTRGAIETIDRHASDELRKVYLPRMVSGEWTGVMALTESTAGTDLGLLKSEAEPLDEKRYAISGSKIFISSGDHDFGGNIVHLVLARLTGAPAGVRGISLFLVPKFIPDSNGEPGERNRISIGGLEQKMGIHAQPTCTIHYEGAIGWLVGEPNRGLNAMFTMMNAERLYVGVQGLGLSEAAYQAAAVYARERLQGRSKNSGPRPVRIVEHPDVRRMLLSIRAFVESARALGSWVALQMDIAAGHPDLGERKSAEALVGLLTPVVKGAFTDFGFKSTVLAQQVFGGLGYVRAVGVEQFVRDARITQIYEGTNGVQALDLASRKLLQEDGFLAHRFFALVARDLEGASERGYCRGVVEPVQAALERLREQTVRLQSLINDPTEIGAAATAYLELFALVSLGWMWVKLVDAAAGSLSAAAVVRSKRAVAQFFVDHMLPRTISLAASVEAGANATMALESSAF